MQRLVGPCVAQINALHHSCNILGGFSRAIAVGRLHEQRGRARVLFDVMDIVTKPLKPDEIMQILPDHPSHWHVVRHHAEHDDFLSRTNVHALLLTTSRLAKEARARRRRCMVCISKSCLYKPSASTNSSCVPR